MKNTQFSYVLAICCDKCHFRKPTFQKDITSILTKQLRYTQALCTICLHRNRLVNIRTMRVLFHNLPQKNVCCHKPYKHQMPTLKRRFDILFSEQNNSLNAQQREARVTHHFSKIQQKQIHSKKKIQQSFLQNTRQCT